MTFDELRSITNVRFQHARKLRDLMYRVMDATYKSDVQELYYLIASGDYDAAKEWYMNHEEERLRIKYKTDT